MDWGAIFGGSGLTVLFSSAVLLAMPTALAALGETVCERAGVLNLGLEGMMLSGALGAFLGAYYAHSPVVGTLCGIVVGVAMGALMAFLSVTLKTEQVINGIALVLFAQGMTAFLFEQLFGGEKQPTIPGIPDLKIPLLGSIPGVGPVLFDQNALLYVSGGVALAIWLLLMRTRFGLSVRAVGERPEAADAAAVDVARTRWTALLICGGMAGLGGTLLVIGDLNLFQPNITGGRGWVAIALVIFGRWNPLLVFSGVLLFGFADALQVQVRAVSGGTTTAVPYELFQALPYIVTLVVLVTATVVARSSAQPAALGIPFHKDGGRS
ncbi:MAG TPA: ABC transporter permease [Solirubrobacteraceae bacterium]|jgi:simple sugar transport system permease protein